MFRVLLILAALSLPAAAADDLRVPYLEQELRNVQRQLTALTRQVEALQNQPSRPASRPIGAPAAPPAAEDARWIDAAKWRALRPGMSELEVIGVLGPPTSMREEDGSRVLLYAIEIGSSGFLGGSVKLRDRAIVEIRTPTLQ